MDERGSRIWIQGDLHAENFGTYLDSDGRLVFDVNDFDEAYLGHWTWDLQRFAASLALLCWRKALPDEAIDALVRGYAAAYLDQIRYYVDAPDDTVWALTLDTAEGAVLDALHVAKLQTRVALLDSVTVVDGYRRTFAERGGVRQLPDAERAAVDPGVRGIPRHDPPASSRRRDVRRAGPGGQERLRDRQRGPTGLHGPHRGIQPGPGQRCRADHEAGQCGSAEPRRADDRLREAFQHHGHRTAVSQRALQAHADRFLGWTSIPLRGKPTGFVVSELSPYAADLDWDEITEPQEIGPLVDQLGRATAKIHCVSDEESEASGVSVVGFSVEAVIADAVDGNDEAFVDDIVAFAHAYAGRARADHRLFVDAFRAGGFALVDPTAPPRGSSAGRRALDLAQHCRDATEHDRVVRRESARRRRCAASARRARPCA